MVRTSELRTTGLAQYSPSSLSILPAFLDVVLGILLFVNREKFGRIDFESRTNLQNRREGWASLTVFDKANERPIETCEFCEFFLGYFLGFPLFLEYLAKNLFFLHSCLNGLLNKNGLMSIADYSLQMISGLAHAARGASPF